MDAAPLELGIPRHCSGAYGHVGPAYIRVSKTVNFSYEQDQPDSILNIPWVKLGD